MPLSKRQLALVHIRRKQLGIDDAEYRRTLHQITGKTSATELDQGELTAVLGWWDYRYGSPADQLGQDYGDRKDMASFAQLELIRSLWQEFTRGRYEGEEELNKWLLRSFKLSSLRFLTAKEGQRVITALKAMRRRSA